MGENMQATGISGAVPERASSKQSDTVRELNLLEMATKDLVKVNARIYDRLSPILKSEIPKEAISDSDKKTMSTLATKINEIRGAVDREVINQQCLYSRLDI